MDGFAFGSRGKAGSEEAVDPASAAKAFVNPTPKGELKSMSEPMRIRIVTHSAICARRSSSGSM